MRTEVKAVAVGLLLALLPHGSGASGELTSPDLEPSAGPPVIDFSCLPDAGIVGQLDTYVLTFRASDTIPVAGYFRITFPAGFDHSAAVATYSDAPGVSDQKPDFQSLLVILDSTGSPAAAGTQLQLTLTDVANPVLAGEFLVALEILDADSLTLFGPTLSEPFQLAPGLPVMLEGLPSGVDTMAAGETRLYAALARDAWDNEVPGLPVEYRIEPDSLGSFEGDLLSARRTGAGRIIATYAALADTSATLVVLPGPLAAWELAGLPSQVEAGQAASASPVLVTARDGFGNLQFLYADSVYFATADSLASLPASMSAPYLMTAQDSGRASFAGSSFVWRTAGADSLHLQGGGVRLSRPVWVSPSEAVNCQLSAPGTVVAGVPFTLSVTGVKDRFGNATDGLITLTTSSLDSAAPNGQIAVLPTVSAIAGAGTTQVVLYKAGGYPIFGHLGDSLRQTANITVLPDSARSFSWTVPGTVVVGMPVTSACAVTALDKYRNRVTNYPLVGAPVTLTASTGDSVSPRLLAAADFPNGEVNLQARGFTYFGSGGTVRFVATATQASGTSAPVLASALFAESLALDVGTARRGVDTLTGTIRVRLLGLGSVTITGLELGTSQGTFALSDVTPALPAHLSGPTVTDFQFRWPLPGGLTEGTLRLTGRVLAQFPSGAAVEECPDSASLTIVRGSLISVISLVPGLVAYDDVRYLATFTNTGGVGLSFHLDSSLWVFANGTRRDTARAVSDGVAYLGPSDTLQVEYLARHTAAFQGDSASAQWTARGTELEHPVVATASAPTRLRFAPPASLSYLTGSLTPGTLALGQAGTMRLRIRNSGGVTVTGVSAKLELAGLTDTVRVDLTDSPLSFANWLPGDTTLTFAISQSDLQIDTGRYLPRVSVSGFHNRIDTVFGTVVADSVRVVNQPTLHFDSLWIGAPNRPLVSTGQSFTISAAVRNTGADVIDSLRLKLNTDGFSAYADTILSVLPLIVGGSRIAVWTVSADTDANPLETFFVELVSGLGRVTRLPAMLSGIQKNYAAVQIQESANLSVEARLFSPADALDGRIQAGSPFEVAGKFVNQGDAGTSGAQLTIATTGGLEVTGPEDTILRAQDVEAIWTLKAPNADTTATIMVYFAQLPQDLNTGDTAQVAKSADTLIVRIVFEAPPLRVADVQTEGGAIAGPYVPLSWSWSNEDPTGLFPILVQNLAVEATAADGVTQLDASSLVESAQLELELDTIPALISGGTLRFGTDSLSRVAPGHSENVVLRIWPRLSGSLTEFRWVTRGTLWQAVERSVGGDSLSVPVLDERGASLNISSELAFIPGREVSNYPNPFKAGSEITHIQYELSAPSPVKIAIFAASGHEVWKYEAASGSLGGQAGPNTVDWDGRNGKGDVVVDGVYFARVQAAQLESTLKIVVMK